MTSRNTPEHPAIYARISADPDGYAVGVTDQAAQGHDFIEHNWPDAEIAGPDCQCKECRRFSVPADVYCDNDITASGKKARPHYERLLADIEAGLVDAVVTSDTDRLHRSPMELERYINVCEPQQVPTYTIKKGEIDLTNSTGRLVARMLGAAARHEWERMVERQLNAKRRTRDAGLRSGGTPPFGYRRDDRDDHGRQIPGVSRGMVIFEPEGTAVRKAFADVLSGVSLTSIATQWNQAGLRTARQRVNGGKPWHVKTVGQVLRNPSYAGLITRKERRSKKDGACGDRSCRHLGCWDDGIIGEAQWEPLVSVDTWHAVKAVIADPGRKTSPGSVPRWLLTGVLICGVCGCRSFAARTNRNGLVSYMCHSAFTNPGAAESGWHLGRNQPLLDQYVEGIVLKRLSRADALAALNARPEIDLLALDARRNAITAELDEWARTPGITPRQLQIRNKPLLDELGEIEQQITEGLRGDPLPEFGGKDPAKVWYGDESEGIPPLPIERKRAVVAMLLRVRLLRVGRGGARGPGYRLDYSKIEILPPDA